MQALQAELDTIEVEGTRAAAWSACDSPPKATSKVVSFDDR